MKQKGFAPILIILLIAVLGIGGYFVYTTNYSNKRTETAPIVNQTNPTPTPAESTSSAKTTSWKTYTNTNFGFSFSYPPSITVSVGPDFCGGCTGSILIGDDSKNVLINFVTMRTGQGAYCDEGGSTIDLSLTPAPTAPMQIAESEARCSCSTDGSMGYETCSKALNEKVLPTTNSNPIGYQFYLEQDSYKSTSKLTGSKIIGPYQAYFFPKPITFQGTENIGIYFKLEKQDSLNTFNQILSTFKFTQ